MRAIGHGNASRNARKSAGRHAEVSRTDKSVIFAFPSPFIPLGQEVKKGLCNKSRKWMNLMPKELTQGMARRVYLRASDTVCPGLRRSGNLGESSADSGGRVNRNGTSTKRHYCVLRFLAFRWRCFPFAF
jgi:hypothetical protein